MCKKRCMSGTHVLPGLFSQSQPRKSRGACPVPGDGWRRMGLESLGTAGSPVSPHVGRSRWPRSMSKLARARTGSNLLPGVPKGHCCFRVEAFARGQTVIFKKKCEAPTNHESCFCIFLKDPDALNLGKMPGHHWPRPRVGCRRSTMHVTSFSSLVPQSQ